MSHDRHRGSQTTTPTYGVGPYELFILALTGCVFLAFVARTLVTLPDHARRNLQIVDDAIFLVILIDIASVVLPVASNLAIVEIEQRGEKRNMQTAENAVG